MDPKFLKECTIILVTEWGADLNNKLLIFHRNCDKPVTIINIAKLSSKVMGRQIASFSSSYLLATNSYIYSCDLTI